MRLSRNRHFLPHRHRRAVAEHVVHEAVHERRLLVDEQVGRWAAVMLGCCQAYFLFTLDLRTDTMLTACIAIAIAQIMEFSIGDGRLYRLISGFLFVGLAMLAKGPIGLMIPISPHDDDESDNYDDYDDYED